MRRSARRLRMVVACSMLMTAACDGGLHIQAPEVALVGTYHATQWHLVAPDRDIDMIAHGAHITMQLKADGTVTGDFYVPANVAPDAGEDMRDLAGKWRLQDGSVWFDQEGDTYVKFTPWTIGVLDLHSQIQNGPWTIRTVLTRDR